MTAAEAAPPPADPAWLVERYEELRRACLAGRAEGPRLGLALLVRQGVSAWAAAWDDLGRPARPEPRGTLLGPVPPAPLAGPVVSLLASMALAASAPRRP